MAYCKKYNHRDYFCYHIIVDIKTPLLRNRKVDFIVFSSILIHHFFRSRKFMSWYLKKKYIDKSASYKKKKKKNLIILFSHRKISPF